jgi:hypothetical protein
VINELPALERKLEGLADKLDSEVRKKALRSVGDAGKNLADSAVRADLGDMSMSNWQRGKPFDITSRYDLQGDSAVEISPARRAKGPMRVLESGRQSYAAGDKRSRGMGKVRKDGTRREKLSTVKRNVAATKGMSTWSDATQKMETELPKVVHEAVQDVLRKFF